jgi:hypothetical protein
MKKTILFFLLNAGITAFVSAQNVGIGTTTPAYKLDVAGAVHSTGNAYLEGAVGIGTVSPNYKLQVDNGAIAMYNESTSKVWYFNYTTSGGGYFYLAEDGVNRFTVANGGNIGIGTAAPTVKLDVNGAGRYSGSLAVGNDITIGDDVTAAGDIAAAGNVTAHGGGVLYNTVSPAATNLKVYYRTAAFTVTNLAPHALTIEAAVGIGGGFTSPPMVFVGDQTDNAGEAGHTAGPLHVLQLQTYGSTTGQFNIRILNTSESTVSQTVTWNVMCIGY